MLYGAECAGKRSFTFELLVGVADNSDGIFKGKGEQTGEIGPVGGGTVNCADGEGVQPVVMQFPIPDSETQQDSVDVILRGGLGRPDTMLLKIKVQRILLFSNPSAYLPAHQDGCGGVRRNGENRRSSVWR